MVSLSVLACSGCWFTRLHWSIPDLPMFVAYLLPALVALVLIIHRNGWNFKRILMLSVFSALCLLVLFGKMKAGERREGILYRLDRVALKEDFVQELRSESIASLSSRELVDALVVGPPRRAENAAVILKARALGARDPKAVAATLDALESVESEFPIENVERLIEIYSELQLRVDDGSPMTVPGTLPISGPSSRRIKTH